MTSAGTLHLLIGPVGAGKTTWAQRQRLASPALFLDLDAWMVRLFGADPRPPADVMAWYLERRERCRAVLWDVALDALSTGADVFLEIGLLRRDEREAFYQRAHDDGLNLRIHLLDAPREVRRERVAQRNQTPGPFTQRVPPELFERASDAWEPPTEAERTTWGITEP